VLALLRRARYLPLRALHEEILREIEAFNEDGNSFADDVTILSCRFK
jgi:sigma-B regulation protein RsbU (phosphoserine phosphatase)